MNRVPCLLLAVWTLATLGIAAEAPKEPATPRPPNIVFILADDLGFMDVNAFAQRLTGSAPAEMYYETPHLDRLVRGGMAFSQAYACQLCSPTRAGLLTGRNPARIGVTTATPGSVKTFYNTGLTPPPGYLANDTLYWGDKITVPQSLLNGASLDALPSGQTLDHGRDEVTFAEVLPGHQSAFIGKWHLGSHGARGWQPQDQGFDPLAYTDEGGSSYFQWRTGWDDRRMPPQSKMPQPEWCHGKAGPETGEAYLTDSLTELAVRHLRERAADTNGRPFLLYLCHLAVHTPLQAKAADIAYFEKKSTRGWNHHSNAVYAAMIKSLDDSVGRITETLESSGLSTNTLVVFMSDNGGVSYTTPPVTSNAPLKGGKAMLFEGGIRVPLILRWPGHIPEGTWSNVPVDYADIFSTLVEAAGGDPASHAPRLDGRSLVPLFSDPGNTGHGYPRTTRYWHYPFNVAVAHPDDGLPLTPQSAIREGDYKLIHDWSGRLFLHDLATDWREEHNLAEAQPERARELFVKLHDWLDRNVSPKYTPLLNPDYDPATNPRAYPFVDLRAKLLEKDRAIRPASSDPRVRIWREFTPNPGAK